LFFFFTTMDMTFFFSPSFFLFLFPPFTHHIPDGARLLSRRMPYSSLQRQ
jgi:hypothetical protein